MPGLTVREQQILRLVAEGLTSREIAGSERSERTIRNQLVRIYEKLEVNNAAAAVAVGFRRGVLQ